MMDIEYFEAVLNAPKAKQTIEIDEHFSREDFAWLRAVGMTKAKQFFKPADSYCNRASFSVDGDCPKCGASATFEGLSKTKLVAMVSHNEIPLCAECAEKEKQCKKQIIKAEDERRKTMIPDWIAAYLDPDKKWNLGVSQDSKWAYVSRTPMKDPKAVAEAIQALPYNVFLDTPYWKAVASEVRSRARYQCSLCGEKRELHVHHRTYDLHGYEHTSRGMKELIAICDQCHAKHHGGK